MRPVRIAGTLWFALALVLGFIGAVPVAQGATITPTVFTDDNADNGNCTLREAVLAANNDAAEDACPAGAGADTVVLQPGTYTLTVPGFEDLGVTGDLDVLGDLTITGPRAPVTVIDGEYSSGVDRIFEIYGVGTDLTISGATIQDGASGGQAGGIYVDSDASLVLIDSVVRSNEAVDGAGVFAAGTLTMQRVTVTDNAATAEGGGIYVEGSATLTDVTVSGNSAGSGGGILEGYLGGSLSLTNVTISGNTVTGSGGGIESFDSVTVNNVTITGNHANSDNAGVADEGGGVVIEGGTFAARNSVIANNTIGIGGVNPDCAEDPGFESLGHNLVEDPGTDCQVTGAGDIIGQDPLLGPLADNGGPTQTHALLLGSPAIDAGGADCAVTDQRGVPRSACDIGAYELALCRKVVVNRVGISAKDALVGTQGADGFLGFQGNDTLRGKAGKDGLCGGPGRDTLKGGGGKDRLDGGQGKDTCVGQAGRDKAKACEREKSL